MKVLNKKYIDNPTYLLANYFITFQNLVQFGPVHSQQNLGVYRLSIVNHGRLEMTLRVSIVQ